MGTQEALPMQLASGLSEVEEQGYKCFLSIMEWHAKAGMPEGLDLSILRDTDVIVTAFPKCGNTLTQQICYQIAVASGGAPETDPTGDSFTDFNRVSPWLEYMDKAGVEPCESFPRVFKSHLAMSHFPTPLKSKHIIVLRSPLAFPSSALDFLFDSVVPDADNVSEPVRQAAFNAMTQGFLLYVEDNTKTALSPWHAHVKKNLTIAPEDEKNVLVLCYEDIVQDLRGTIQKVAKFMQCDISNEGMNTVLKRCDRHYMASREAFGMISEAKVFDTPGRSFMKAKVKRTDGFKQFKVNEKYIAPIQEMNKAAFGFADYEDLRDSINKKMSRIHGF